MVADDRKSVVVAAGVALVAGMMAGTAWGWSPDYLATGGDVKSIYTNVAGVIYGIHSFTTVGSATFTPSRNLTVEYLVIGGGGGGGGSAWGGGGGGAGGYRCSVVGEKSGGNTDAEARTSLTSGVGIEVRVGVGGEGGTWIPLVAANQGSNSWFGGIIALGGGGGGLAGTFGSGGGASHGGDGAGPAGSGTVGQGCNGGGTYDSANIWGGGGGGGALANGSGTTGAGGDGLASSVTGTSVTRAGGGKGGGNGGGSAGSGASNAGGGGEGKSIANGTAGQNGIVIVRYEISPIKGTLILMR